jgi:hypothetical protein
MDAILNSVKPIYLYCKFIAVFPFSLTQNGVKVSKLNVFQLAFAAAFFGSFIARNVALIWNATFDGNYFFFQF